MSNFSGGAPNLGQQWSSPFTPAGHPTAQSLIDWRPDPNTWQGAMQSKFWQPMAQPEQDWWKRQYERATLYGMQGGGTVSGAGAGIPAGESPVAGWLRHYLPKTARADALQNAP